MSRQVEICQTSDPAREVGDVRARVDVCTDVYVWRWEYR